MPEPALSVVMPTYNRLAILQRALHALESQTLSHERFEVVVVDDGSTDDTQAFLADYAQASPLHVRTLSQRNSGPATARNRGVREASGWAVLFIGDDIIAAPDLLQQHFTWHQERPEDHIAVLGLTTWDPTRPISPFMRWLENGGPQYKFWSITDPENVTYRHFYTSNVSVKRRFLLDHGLFDEDFPYASYEDIELAYRLEQQGMRLVYNAQAIGHHDHYTSLDNAIRRMRRVGESQCIYLQKTGQEAPRRPRQSPVRKAAGRVKFNALRWLGERAERRWVVPPVYSYLMDKSMGEGVYARGTRM